MALYFKFRYVSCTLGCPYEGNITPQKVTEVRYTCGFLVLGKMMYNIFKSGLFSLLLIASAQPSVRRTMEDQIDHLTSSFILTLKMYILATTIQS